MNAGLTRLLEEFGHFSEKVAGRVTFGLLIATVTLFVCNQIPPLKVFLLKVGFPIEQMMPYR